MGETGPCDANLQRVLACAFNLLLLGNQNKTKQKEKRGIEVSWATV
jgi:hypothetical protein